MTLKINELEIIVKENKEFEETMNKKIDYYEKFKTLLENERNILAN